MGKRFMKKLLVLMAAFCMMLGMALPAYAEEDTSDSGSAAVTGTTEDPANGILQVWLAYEDDGGKRTYFSGGTCFLINEEYVLTNKHIYDLDMVDEGSDLTLRQTIMSTLGLEELPDNDPHLKLYVFANRDTSVEATVHENAESDVLDFAALQLKERIYGRDALVLGDSDSIAQRDNVYAYGFPKDSVQNKKFNTKEDVSISSGIISKVTVQGQADIIEHTAQLNNGNSGGPLINEAGEVIGINAFMVDDKKYYSIQINAIKEILDTWGITYTPGPNPGPGKTTSEATLEDLQAEIDSANALSLDGYTADSVQAFKNAVSNAESVASGNPDADAIQAAIDEISAAQSGLKPEPEPEPDDLEEKESGGMNWLLIGGIIFIVVIVIVAVVVIIVVTNNSKKKKAKQIPPMQKGMTPPVPPSPAAPPVSPVQPGGYPNETDGAGETTLLDAGAGETTLLGGGAGNAYLIRKKNGERIPVTSQNFAIGKERRRVNYCISDNTSVSRYHVVITKKGSDYYAADQKSSNYTFVNGVQLSPYQETLLTDRSTLKLSDEEFEFHIS